MGSLTPDFRFWNFVGSVVWLVFIVLALVTLLILPIIFFTLFYVPLPVVDGQVLTPYLFFSMMVDPSRTLPVSNFLFIPTFLELQSFQDLGSLR
jgi:NADH-quinone oxidoreductase subunit H